jgi:phosphoglucomutase
LKFTFQPIRSKFTFYGDFSPGCDELRERDTDGWWSTLGKLQILLRKAADEAFKENKFTAEDRHQFFQSGRFIHQRNSNKFCFDMMGQEVLSKICVPFHIHLD